MDDILIFLSRVGIFPFVYFHHAKTRLSFDENFTR